MRSARRSALHTLRWSGGGQLCTATLPDEAGAEQDSARARAVWALGRDDLGLPLSRLHGEQALLGVPVPEATQGDQIEAVGDCRAVVGESLERLAAQGALLSQDETAVRMLSRIGEKRTMRAHAEAMGLSRPHERTGLSPTALVVTVGEQTSCRSERGRAHAGENLKAWLAQRQVDVRTPLVMSDALVSHAAEDTTLMRGHWLAHGRRQCRALQDVFPPECQVVSDARKQVCAHDEQARDEPRSPAARLVDHRDARGPMLADLTRWLDTQGDDRLVEPHRAVGKAVASMRGHGETLPRCFLVAGAPRDNHLVARALQLCIRQRTPSLCSQTASSASRARVLTSLIATCLHAGVNALESLVALPAHRTEVLAAPSAWLPWTSQARRVPPEAMRRQSWAIWARSGSPFHRTRISARADRGTRASAGVGHQVHRPCETRFRHRQEPCPS